MGSSDKFCLRWNDFESNISSAFSELRDEGDFFDVTLSCEDGSKQIPAHKLILSACSPFFKTVLRGISGGGGHSGITSNPVLYLRGVNYSDLVSVLNFMYHGEANVAQDDLNSFLSVAEELSVKGLTTGEQQQGARSRATPTKSTLHTPTSAAKRPKSELSNSNNSAAKRSKLEAGTAGSAVVKSEISAVMSEAPGEDDFGGGGDEEDDEDSFQLEEGFEASGGGDEDYGDDYGGSEMDPIAGTSADGADGAKDTVDYTVVDKSGILHTVRTIEQGTARGQPMWDVDGYEYLLSSKNSYDGVMYLRCRAYRPGLGREREVCTARAIYRPWLKTIDLKGFHECFQEDMFVEQQMM